MLKRQAGVTDAQQATSLTYSVVKCTKILKVRSLNTFEHF